jgi:1,2-diacylglycerol 3-alpha-glucosyltransferase
MDSLKIALASDWFYPKVGGIEAHIDELARNLLKVGHQPYVITHDYRYMKPYDGNFPYPVKRFGATFYIKKHHISLSPTQLIRINEFYKSENFDLTHIHSIYSPLAIAVANVSRGVRDVPVVATNHSFFGNPPLAELFRWELRQSLKRVDHFIAVSTPVARDTERLIGELRKERPVTVIPNGIDTERWRPPEPEEREEIRRRLGVRDEIVLFYVGRMTERKLAHRLPFVIARAIERSGIERRAVRFIAVGEGEKRKELERNVMAAGLEEITDLFNFLPRERIRELYWAADVVLMPGILEAFPVVGLEAMASGRPVVGRVESGLSDMIVDGLTGYLAGSEEEMAEKLAILLENPELGKKMGIAGRKLAVATFSWNRVLRRILRVYKVTIDRADEVDRKYILYKLSRELG